MSLFPRHATDSARKLLAESPILTIEGARQVGKTTFVRQLCEERGGQFLTMDDSDDLRAVLEDPDVFFDQTHGRLVAFDDVHLAPEVLAAVASRVASQGQPGQFILSGPASFASLPGAHDLTHAQTTTLVIYPFSAGERSGHADDVATALLTGRAAGWNGWRGTGAHEDAVRWVARGGYPVAAEREPSGRRRWLDNYLHRQFHRDAANVGHAANPADLTALARALATPQDPEGVAHAADETTQTAERGLRTLEALRLVETLPPWAGGSTEQPHHPPKPVIVDSALAATLAGTGEASLLDGRETEKLASLVSGYVVGELLRQRTWSAQDYTLHHWRDDSGATVDALVELTGGRAIGVASTAAQTPRFDHGKHLVAMREALGAHFIVGVVFHLGTAAVPLAPDVWALPLAALWEL